MIQAEGERRDGDAELGGCEVGVKMVDGSLERPGATLFLFHELCHSAAPDGDQGELGGDKEAIWPTSRRIARSPAMSIQMLLAVGIVTSHRPGAVSAAFALPPDPEQVWLSGLTPRQAEPAVEIGKGAAGKRSLPVESLRAVGSLASRMRLSSNWREQAEIDIHRLEAPRVFALGAEMAAGDVTNECAERRGRKRRREFLPESLSCGKAAGD